MKVLFRSSFMHDASLGPIAPMSSEKVGSVRRGGGGDAYGGWNDQSLGAGHVPASSNGGAALIVGSRCPPRFFGSALNGHGGSIKTPEWPLGHNWSATTGLSALGTIERVRYMWKSFICIGSTDTLTWGPAEFGIGTSPSGITFSSVWGAGFVIGSRTGDGSGIPNDQDGWKSQHRYSNGGAYSAASGNAATATTIIPLTAIYLDSPVSPLLRFYFNRTLKSQYTGTAFTRVAGATDGFGPYINGRVLSWMTRIRVDLLEDTENPWANIFEATV